MPGMSRAWWALAGALTLCAIVLWPGLSGTFILDDFENLRAIQRWLEGGSSFWHAVTATGSGVLKRPIAFASFAGNGALGGLLAFELKLTNLAIHLLCGVLVFLVARAVFARDRRLHAHGAMAATIVAAAWLLAPSNVSTVLYIVQRMAQLSTLFVLLGAWVYLTMRARMIERPRDGVAPVLALLAMFAITLVAGLSKENGLLLPGVVFAAEWLLFPAKVNEPRPRAIRWFLIAAVVLPMLVVAVEWSALMRWLARGYAERSFTLEERLLTQGRVLWSYVGNLLIPDGRRLGLIHDNYLLSQGWLSPWTTLVAWLGWAVVVIVAWWGHRREPVFAFGIAFFLITHLAESSVVPLEMYFEHRNYLPGVGILIALAPIITRAGRWLDARLPPPRRPLERLAIGLWLALCTFATFNQARIWSDNRLILAHDEQTNPYSLRLNALLLAQAIEDKDYAAANQRADHLLSFAPDSARQGIALWRLIGACLEGSATDAQVTQVAGEVDDRYLSQDEMRAFEMIADRVINKQCGAVTPAALATLGRDWLAASEATPTRLPVWRTRYNYARLLEAQGDATGALREGHRAWIDGGREPGAALMVFRVAAAKGDLAMCREVLDDLLPRTGRGDYDLDSVVEQMRDALAQATRGAGDTPPTPAKSADPAHGG